MNYHYGKKAAPDAMSLIIKDHQTCEFEYGTLQIINRQIEDMNITAHNISERQTQSETVRT